MAVFLGYFPLSIIAWTRLVPFHKARRFSDAVTHTFRPLVSDTAPTKKHMRIGRQRFCIEFGLKTPAN
jgi:hypothetical protein